MTDFAPRKIVDTAHDETRVSVDDEDVFLRVYDQSLADKLEERFEGQHYAVGVYNLDEAKALRDALDAAIAHIEAKGKA